MTDSAFTVQDRPQENRYVLLDGTTVIGEESYVDVQDAAGPARVLHHTGVSDEYAGQGLASVLVLGAVSDVVAGGRRIVPVCPYVAKWLPRHPEFAEHVTEPTAAHLQAVRDQQA
ncbi:GNAT family N-acetyltransferase [Dermacoccaceae bacterium W4C1]